MRQARAGDRYLGGDLNDSDVVIALAKEKNDMPISSMPLAYLFHPENLGVELDRACRIVHAQYDVADSLDSLPSLQLLCATPDPHDRGGRETFDKPPWPDHCRPMNPRKSVLARPLRGPLRWPIGLGSASVGR